MGLFDTNLEEVRAGKPKKADKVEPLLGLNYRGLLDAATMIPVAGDVLSGGLAAYDYAKGDYGSAALNAVGMLPFIGGAGIFAGKGAKTADVVKMAQAEKMLSSGVDPASVWKQTGWANGADGKMRFEISDNSANPLSQTKDKVAVDYLQMGGGLSMYPSKIGKALDHANLYSGYPELADIRTSLMNVKKNGAYSKNDGHGEIIETSFAHNKNGFLDDPQDAKSTTLHELQHAIQQREGFAKGGSPESFVQQKDAELARDALAWRRELLSEKAKYPNADTIALENKLIEQYQKQGAMDWVPSRDARELATQPDVLFSQHYPNAEGGYSDLEKLVKAYGLDKRTSPYTPNEAYQRLAGEAEARLTQYRMALTPEERLAQYPYDPEYFRKATGVNINDLIVRGLLD
jgi:hypothetical protein